MKNKGNPRILKHRKCLFFSLFCFVLLQTPLARAEWQRAESAHFIIYYEGNEAETRAFSERLERFDATLRRLTGIADNQVKIEPNRLTIFAYADDQTPARLLGNDEVMGFYRATMSGDFAYSGTADEDINREMILFHEYTHHFMFKHFPASYPVWYVEGFAEFFATAHINPDGSVNLGYPPRFRSYELLNRQDEHETGTLIQKRFDPTKFLDRPIGAAIAQADIYRLYAFSWAMVRVMFMDPQRSKQLRIYLREYSQGVPPKTAAKAFGDMAELRRQIYREISAMKTKITYLSLPPGPPLPSAKIATLPQAHWNILEAWAQSVSDTKSAKSESLIRTARQLTQSNPGSVMAWDALAESQLLAGDTAQAQSANERLRDLAPKDARALARRARIAAAGLRAQMATDQRWTDVRKLAVVANRADPDATWPYFLVFESFIRQRQALTANASKAIDFALRTAPGEEALRLFVAANAMRQNQVDRARMVGAPLFNSVHGQKVEKVAQAILETQPGTTTGLDIALAYWDAEETR